MIRTATVVTSLLAYSLVASSHANILLNPGFESGTLAPWYQAADFSEGFESWNVISADAHSGNFSATAIGNKRIQQDFAPVPVASILEVSFWQRHPEPNTGLAIYFAYQDGTNEEIVRISTTQWQSLDFTSELDAGKHLVGVGVWGYSNRLPMQDRSYVDDFVLRVAVPEPHTLTLLALATSLLLPARRTPRS